MTYINTHVVSTNMNEVWLPEGSKEYFHVYTIKQVVSFLDKILQQPEKLVHRIFMYYTQAEKLNLGLDITKNKNSCIKPQNNEA